MMEVKLQTNSNTQGANGALGSTPQQREKSVASLIDDMRCDDQKKRIASLQNLGAICSTLGAERTRTELLPYLAEIILDDDDDTLLVLASSVANILREVGGLPHVFCIINILEKLCCIEEPTVRERATQNIKTLFGQIKIRENERFVMQTLQRLSKGEDQITSKIAAVQLVPAVFAQVQSTAQLELIDMIKSFSQDEMPQIRKHCAISLSELITILPKISGGAATTVNHEQELLTIFTRFQGDEQDSVRMQCIESCVSFAKTLPANKMQQFLLPCVKKFAEDKSWRIRYLMADRIMDLSGVGVEQAAEHLLPLFVSFLKDTESEVRTAATSRMGEFCKFISNQQLVVTKVLPCLKDLQTDQFNYVKCALAENLLSLCPMVGRSITNEQILPIFLALVRDESSEVRLNLFKKLQDLHSVVNIEELQQSIIPSLEELAREKNWRMKQSVIEMFPSLGSQLGEKFFTEKLLPIAMEWLKDSIYSIRKSTLIMMKELVTIFGTDWTQKHLVTPLIAQHKDTSYLQRIIVLIGIADISEKVGFDMMSKTLWPTVQILSKDPVANVRMNVAKTCEILMPLAGQGKATGGRTLVEEMKTMLRMLSNDTDTDVQYYAVRALKKEC